MSEREEAYELADRLLDVPNADPDDDLRMLSRQLLRHRDREQNPQLVTDELKRLEAELARLRTELASARQNFYSELKRFEAEFNLQDAELTRLRSENERLKGGG